MGLLGSLFGGLLGGASPDDKGCDWYCDNCEAYMNIQPGFTTASDEWVCTECGYVNDVSEDNIIFDGEDEFEDESDSLSVYEAAEIWASHGKDEDYTFGYSEEDLENAL